MAIDSSFGLPRVRELDGERNALRDRSLRHGIAIDPGYEGELTEDALTRVDRVGRVVDGVQIKN